MNIGYVAYERPEIALDRAARLGFDGLELGFFQNPPCDLETWTEGDTKRLNDLAAKNNVQILALTTGMMNPLAPDKAAREHAVVLFQRAIKLAPQLGTNIVTCNAFGDPAVRPEKQVKLFGQVFGELARCAEDHGVRIAIENCPHERMEHGIQIGNIAYSPAMFEVLFNEVPSQAVGMEYDPSHYFWLGVDYLGVIRQFADRMVFMHAKDTEVMKDKLGQQSIFGHGWWRYRMPGLGQVDWEGISRALAEIGYNAGMAIEHEDPAFHGERFEEGLALGLKYLRRILRN